LYNSVDQVIQEFNMSSARKSAATVGEQIRRRREEQGLTLKELGDRLGVHFTTVSSWERGRSMPGYDSMPRLASELETSPRDLFGKLWEPAEPVRQSGGLRPLPAEDWDEFRRTVETLRFLVEVERVRANKKIPWKEIAARAGIPAVRVERILGGRDMPDLLEAVSIAAVVGLRPAGSARPETAGRSSRPELAGGAPQSLNLLEKRVTSLPAGTRDRVLQLFLQLLAWIADSES
jgi:transcriptional regulator with XRE-family HTH domain